MKFWIKQWKEKKLEGGKAEEKSDHGNLYTKINCE